MKRFVDLLSLVSRFIYDHIKQAGRLDAIYILIVLTQDSSSSLGKSLFSFTLSDLLCSGQHRKSGKVLDNFSHCHNGSHYCLEISAV